MKIKKSLALFALSICASAVLAACGGSSTNSSSSSNASNSGSNDNFKAVMVSDKAMALITFFLSQNLITQQTSTQQC